MFFCSVCRVILHDTRWFGSCDYFIFLSFRPLVRLTFCVVPVVVSIIVSPGVMPAVVSAGCHEDVICPSTQVKVLEARTQRLESIGDTDRRSPPDTAVHVDGTFFLSSVVGTMFLSVGYEKRERDIIFS